MSNLNWAKIKEENPKAWAEFELFFRDYCRQRYNVIPNNVIIFTNGIGISRTDGVHAVSIEIEVSERICFDFFDSKGIYITVWFDHADSEDYKEYTWSYEIDFEEEYPTYHPYDHERGCGFETKTRMESDRAGIEKAFKILEKRIHEDEGDKKRIDCGDVVIHIALHKIMTVRDRKGRLVACDWFEGEDLKNATFIIEELTLCPDSQIPNAINALQ